MGNGLFINKDLVKDYGVDTILLNNGETYKYGEFMKTIPTLCDQCFDSDKGDFYYFKKGGKR